MLFSRVSHIGESKGEHTAQRIFPSTNTTTELQQTSEVNVLEFSHFSSPWLTRGEATERILIRLKNIYFRFIHIIFNEYSNSGGAFAT